MKPFRILIFGIGGVGGYFGGQLAKTYQNDPSVEIVFIVRGNHLKVIKEKGLTLKTPDKTFTVFPDIATDDASTLGEVDLIWLCTKSYGLDSALEAIKHNIGPNTYILPLLNGAHIHELVQEKLPNANVLQGCVYVNAYKTGAGEVTQKSKVQKFVFGKNEATTAEHIFLDKLNAIMEKTEINLVYAKDVLREIWTKYVFISSTSAISCLTDKTFGEFREDESDMKTVTSLMKEAMALASAKKIDLPNDLVEKHTALINKFPPETVTSMQLDMRNSFKTELETMVGYVPKESRQYELMATVSEQVYRALREKLLQK
ncbi:ketopantoate reductase family protein [Sungkyunkwania multivorans]|uniref:2-dehydropantoate 2-reductase n=1 Tax=Sungkyunkwania multivorans TaxID=1173618 RepID=A0ABW3CZL3_9FLAO